MKQYKIVIFSIFILLNCCKTNNKLPSDSSKNKELEKELVKLKSHAFNLLFGKEIESRNFDINDGTTYIDISKINAHYFLNDTLYKLVDKWHKKEYKSYDKTKNLIIMKCIDFYNSEDLAKYTDSIRKIELQANEKK